jgi:hypothetical protein
MKQFDFFHGLAARGEIATVLAQQVGVHRDPLVAALFGPTRGVAA